MSHDTTTQQIAVVDLRRQLRAASVRAVGRALGKSALVGLSTFAIVLVIWLLVYFFGGVSPFVMKSPLDVWDFLFVDEDAPEDRAILLANLIVTMRHAGIGFIVGLVVAIIGAITFRISRGVESALGAAHRYGTGHHPCLRGRL
jgi:ABC-type nitrate/sulfonate/bicarbonate transport system permease component